jgi:N-acetylglucosaminyl-diphospho-decaprenol L-rhamnosyltransferase
MDDRSGGPISVTGPRTGIGTIPSRHVVESVAVVVVTYEAMPWVERCLESVAAYETVVVDHGSTDGTVALVRQRFPGVRLIEQENLGLAAGWNRGLRESSAPFVLIHNADAWVAAGAIERMLATLEERPDAAVVGPSIRGLDGRRQQSVRGFPTLWRLSTEYFYLRKLAPRSRALNAFYGGGIDLGKTTEVEWVMGACMLVRRAAVEDVGLLDEAFFLFSEETDWQYRMRASGWKTLFCPEAEVVHVGGAAHGGRMFRENIRGHLRFMTKHHGPREADRARTILLAGLRIRGLVYGGARGRTYRETAAWLASAPAAELLQEER